MMQLGQLFMDTVEFGRERSVRICLIPNVVPQTHRPLWMTLVPPFPCQFDYAANTRLAAVVVGKTIPLLLSAVGGSIEFLTLG